MKIIAFNSYKGGACRTTTCYNTLPYLANALGATSQNPILVFDVDLDSMGLTNLFTKGSRFKSKSGYSAEWLYVDNSEMLLKKIKFNGFKGTVADNDWYFDEAFMKVGTALGLDDNGSVLFCGADREADSLTDDDFEKYANSSPLGFLINKLELMGDNAPKAIVFDCAAGVQLSTRAILSKAQDFVMCMRPSLQFRIGTSDYLLNKVPDELKKGENNDKKRVILLPTAVATVDVPESDKNREEAMEFLTQLKLEVQELIQDDIVLEVQCKKDRGYELDTTMVDRDDMGIPEIERFKWKESLLYKMKPLTDKEARLQESYKVLADLIAKG